MLCLSCFSLNERPFFTSGEHRSLMTRIRMLLLPTSVPRITSKEIRAQRPNRHHVTSSKFDLVLNYAIDFVFFGTFGRWNCG